MLADGCGAALLHNIPGGSHPPGLFLFWIFLFFYFFFLLLLLPPEEPASVSRQRKDNPIFSPTAPTPLAHPASGAERRFENSKLSTLGFGSPNSQLPKWQRRQGPPDQPDEMADLKEERKRRIVG